MSKSNEFTFLSANGKDSIYVHEWLPEGEPRAVLQIAHGLDEHIMRYNDFAQYLAENGILVLGNDHLGHGRSAQNEEDFCFFEAGSGWRNAVEDMRTLYTVESEKNKALPYFLLGHSMGSFLTRTFLIRFPSKLRGAILSGTGQTPPLIINAGLMVAYLEGKRMGERGRSKTLDNMCFGAYNKKFESPSTPVDWLTRDTEILKIRMQDPFCGHVPTVGLFKDMLNGIKFIQNKENLALMDKSTPVLFVSGEKDAVGNMGKGARQAYKAFLDAGCTDLSFMLYPEARHEVLNEINRKEVYKDILNWLDRRLKIAE